MLSAFPVGSLVVCIPLWALLWCAFLYGQSCGVSTILQYGHHVMKFSECKAMTLSHGLLIYIWTRGHMTKNVARNEDYQDGCRAIVVCII